MKEFDMEIQEMDIAVKRDNLSTATDLGEVYRLIERVTNQTYASRVLLDLSEEDNGFDSFEVRDKDGKILIRASNGVGLAAGFNAYLKERCGYSIGALTVSGRLPQVPPAVGEPIVRKSQFLYWS